MARLSSHECMYSTAPLSRDLQVTSCVQHLSVRLTAHTCLQQLRHGLESTPRRHAEEGLHTIAGPLGSCTCTHRVDLLYNRHSPRVHLSSCLSAHCDPLAHAAAAG